MSYDLAIWVLVAIILYRPIVAMVNCVQIFLMFWLAAKPIHQSPPDQWKNY